MKTTFCLHSLVPTRLYAARTAGLFALAMLIGGCGGGDTATPVAAPTTRIVIRGSNTYGEELAPKLVEEFRKDHPNVDFDMEFKGSTYGFGALMVPGGCNIAASSRPPSTNELYLSKDRGIDFDDHIIGSYSVAVVVNAKNPVSNLTHDQIRDIFTGNVKNWKEVGGDDLPINLYVRNPISGTYLGFQELAMENKPYALTLKLFTNYTAIAEAVAQDPGGIGYCSVSTATKDGVKPVPVGGVAPTAEAVNQKQYPYARALHLVLNKQKEAPMAVEFVKFVESERGQKVVAQMEFVPHP